MFGPVYSTDLAADNVLPIFVHSASYGHMLKLEQILKNSAIVGIEPNLVVRIVTTEAVGPDALTVYYKTADGNLRERMLLRSDEPNLGLAEAGRTWAFAERALGHQVIDVSAQKCGWDFTAIPPAKDGKLPLSRHIEVKGRAKGSSTVTVTKNEVLYGLNQHEKFILAIVLVDGDNAETPLYVRRPFTQEPDWAVTSVSLNLNELLRIAREPGAVE